MHLLRYCVLPVCHGSFNHLIAKQYYDRENSVQHEPLLQIYLLYGNAKIAVLGSMRWIIRGIVCLEIRKFGYMVAELML